MTGERYPIACTQAHQLMENRDLVRAATLDQFHRTPRFAQEPAKERELEETDDGTKLHVRESSPEFSIALELRALTLVAA